MSNANDLPTIYMMINLSRLAVEEACSKCRYQFVHLHNQRQALRERRIKRLARQASQNEELKGLYTSLGLGHTS